MTLRFIVVRETWVEGLDKRNGGEIVRCLLAGRKDVLVKHHTAGKSSKISMSTISISLEDLREKGGHNKYVYLFVVDGFYSPRTLSFPLFWRLYSVLLKVKDICEFVRVLPLILHNAQHSINMFVVCMLNI